MARYKCPCCGMAYNGKRCRSCLYETFSEEIAHGMHTHEGAPLVVKTRQPVQQGRTTVRQSGCEVYPGKRKKQSPMWMIPVILLVSFLIRGPLVNSLADGMWEEPEVTTPEFDFDITMPEIDVDIEIPTVPSELQLELGMAIEQEATETAEPDRDIFAEGTVLYDENDILVVADWRDGQEGTSYIPICVQNGSGKDINLWSSRLSVNGFMLENSLFYYDVGAGETIMDYLVLRHDELTRCGIETIAEVSFRMEIYDRDSYALVGISDNITLRAGVAEDFVQPVDDSGTVLYDQGGLKLVYQGCDGNTCNDAWLEFYIENNTDMCVYISSIETAANGVSMQAGLSSELMPGTRMLTAVGLYELTEAGIMRVKDVETLDMVVEVVNSDTWEYVAQPPVIRVKVNS